MIYTIYLRKQLYDAYIVYNVVHEKFTNVFLYSLLQID